ncbi:helix-turn-helix domain-containing protein [Ornithinimicrobium sp. LYQ121]|uniref:helix-turn-helix domain-containing protein n=1 Tax=Ornithinimicrobium sp. LYQ121 TaxID=3378801 RepID=UPI003851BEEC
MNSVTTIDGYYTSLEVAQMMGIAMGTFYNARHAGKELPPTVMLARQHFYPRASTDAWVEKYLADKESR